MRAWCIALPLLLCPLRAGALDCSRMPDPVVGQAWTADQLECIRLSIVTLRYERDEATARAKEAEAGAAACMATATITCPPAPAPVVPVVVASLVGFVTGVGVIVAILLTAPRP